MSEAELTPVDVDAWVDAASDNPEEHRVRRVMCIILFAVAESPQLSSRMVIKGGVLLTLGYGTDRHTRDLDFSTESRVQEEDPETILEELDKALADAARRVDEEVFCRVQSHRVEPPGPDASFPTLRIKVGYAMEGEKQHRRMVQGRDSAHTVIVDLSFNERTCITSAISLEGKQLAAYSLFDQVAEKYRAMIQQAGERRDRVRRQDIYDIYAVVTKGYLATADDKASLLAVMREKFAAREVPCEPNVIDEPEIADRSRRQYHQLQDEIDGELPPFEDVFAVVRAFYLDLPWDTR